MYDPVTNCAQGNLTQHLLVTRACTDVCLCNKEAGIQHVSQHAPAIFSVLPYLLSATYRKDSCAREFIHIPLGFGLIGCRKTPKVKSLLLNVYGVSASSLHGDSTHSLHIYTYTCPTLIPTPM